jgi:hypothetical protein
LARTRKHQRKLVLNAELDGADRSKRAPQARPCSSDVHGCRSSHVVVARMKG